MDIHKNARLTPLGRERMVSMVLGGQTPKAASEAVGVCPRTVRKWVKRYQVDGVAGAATIAAAQQYDRSRGGSGRVSIDSALLACLMADTAPRLTYDQVAARSQAATEAPIGDVQVSRRRPERSRAASDALDRHPVAGARAMKP